MGNRGFLSHGGTPISWMFFLMKRKPFKWMILGVPYGLDPPKSACMIGRDGRNGSVVRETVVCCSRFLLVRAWLDKGAVSQHEGVKWNWLDCQMLAPFLLSFRFFFLSLTLTLSLSLTRKHFGVFPFVSENFKRYVHSISSWLVAFQTLEATSRTKSFCSMATGCELGFLGV